MIFSRLGVQSVVISHVLRSDALKSTRDSQVKRLEGAKVAGLPSQTAPLGPTKHWSGDVALNETTASAGDLERVGV